MLIVANWKMNPQTLKEAKMLFAASKKAVDRLKNVEVVIAPPMLFLAPLREGYAGKKLVFAAQNGHAEPRGSYTGDVSMIQIASLGIPYVIIGHAERRAAGETDDDVRRKTISALTAGLTPIVCVGEKERNSNGSHFEVVRAQLRAAFADVPATKVNKVVVAYEPVWAIGAPDPMTTHDMHEMSIFIRKVITERYAFEEKQPRIAPAILYGGAIDESSAAAMVREGEVGGLLVGRASVDVQRFTRLLQSLA
ncbi:triosephosphate isomerase [bacterium]|nr:triosephosphate isomerase [bacterium]